MSNQPHIDATEIVARSAKVLPAPPSGQRVRLRRGKAPSEGYLQMFRDNRWFCKWFDASNRMNAHKKGGDMSATLVHGGSRRLKWFANNSGSLEGSKKPPRVSSMER